MKLKLTSSCFVGQEYDQVIHEILFASSNQDSTIYYTWKNYNNNNNNNNNKNNNNNNNNNDPRGLEIPG